MKYISTSRAAVVTLAVAATVVGLSGSANAVQDSSNATAAVVQPGPNTVGSPQIKDGQVYGWDMANNTIPWLKLGSDLRAEIRAAQTATVKDGAVTTSKIAPKAVTEDKLSDALQAKINAGGPSYLANWGEIFRNTIGNGRAQLGQSSAGEGLNLTTPTATDAVHFGNEADFAGKPVALTTVKYDVFTTGENAAKGPNNMPSIKFEMNPDVGGATYTTLVYAPDNSTSNTWTSINAGADTGKHWGFTGTYFNADPARCGLNGARCTLTEALAVLGSNAKFISAGIGKGRDFEFHGAVRSLTINSTTYKFTAGGVLAN
ncbi:hypothetical protein [Kribbella steppae]|nr:hypothetical protein [Kribbella steppae]